MARVERTRELLSRPLDSEYLREKAALGWRAVAVVWEREEEGEGAAPSPVDVPFGLKVSDDCTYLEEEPHEQAAMALMLDLISREDSLSNVADELNRRGFRTRGGADWTPAAVFNMHPRLIEAGPKIVKSRAWMDRRLRA